jgi:hypothetical protein
MPSARAAAPAPPPSSAVATAVGVIKVGSALPE